MGLGNKTINLAIAFLMALGCLADVNEEEICQLKDPVEDDKHWKQKRVYFENLSEQPVELWWYHPYHGYDDILQFGGALQPMDKGALNTKMGHLFYFTKIGEGGDRQNALWDVMMESNTTLVTFQYDHAAKEQSARSAFYTEYKERTGRWWENYWPREPVMYHYHNVIKGESIEMITDRTQFHLCSRFEGAPSDEEIGKFYGWDRFQTENERFYIGRINGTNYCRSKVDGADREQMVSWNITNICDKGPNAFRIFNFLSDDEMDHIKNMAQRIGMKRSTVVTAEKMTADRTSRTAWLARGQSFIVDNIIRRIADMVQIPQQRLFRNASSENLQVVHYSAGELYKTHHDYITEKPHSRYITFMMYLNEVKEGGNTSFPMADVSCKNEDGYFGVQPIKGSAVFFYDLLPDGNVDSKTMHQGEPPVDSEKWMTNLWIWDKVFVEPIG